MWTGIKAAPCSLWPVSRFFSLYLRERIETKFERRLTVTSLQRQQPLKRIPTAK